MSRSDPTLAASDSGAGEETLHRLAALGVHQQRQGVYGAACEAGDTAPCHDLLRVAQAAESGHYRQAVSNLHPKGGSMMLDKSIGTPKYHRPVLRVLCDMRDGGVASEVLERVRQLVEPESTDWDRDKPARIVRWQHGVRGALTETKRKGLIEQDPVSKVYRITEKGREYLRSRRSVADRTCGVVNRGSRRPREPERAAHPHGAGSAPSSRPRSSTVPGKLVTSSQPIERRTLDAGETRCPCPPPTARRRGFRRSGRRSQGGVRGRHGSR